MGFMNQIRGRGQKFVNNTVEKTDFQNNFEETFRPWFLTALFIMYFAASIALITSTEINRYPDKRPGCFVQQTYRQEFLANMAANPFYSSTSVFQSSPQSGLEIAYFNSTNRTQAVRDVNMFPVMIYDPVNVSAFLPVVEKPRAEYIAGVLAPARAMADGTYYWDSEYQNLIPNKMPYPLAVNIAIQSAIINNVKKPLYAGMQLPNFGRWVYAQRCHVCLHACMSVCVCVCAGFTQLNRSTCVGALKDISCL
jgi:hypothetical protein